MIVDVTSQVNANGGDSVTFTAQNQGGNLGLGDYIYCFEIMAAAVPSGRTAVTTESKSPPTRVRTSPGSNQITKGGGAGFGLLAYLLERRGYHHTS